MEMMSLLLIWAALMGIVVIYVAYRLLTDRPRGDKRHALYPLVSRPSDPAFPGRRDILGWIAYLLLLLGVIGFLVGIYIEVRMGEISASVNALTGMGLLGGIALMAIACFRNRHKR